MNVCLYLIQIHISEPIGTKLCTCLPRGLEETVGYVWARNSGPLRAFGPFFFRVLCRIMGTRWLPAQPFSVIPLYPWFQICSRDVTDIMLWLVAESSAAALYP